ncbi:MAG: hypothetical protein JKX74_00085 [Flavobacteriales bacterium]|nr:hypothetical protein [Flavobacteriales bacterium]
MASLLVNHFTLSSGLMLVAAKQNKARKASVVICFDNVGMVIGYSLLEYTISLAASFRLPDTAPEYLPGHCPALRLYEQTTR